MQSKTDILSSLKKEVLLLQGFKAAGDSGIAIKGLERITDHLPGKSFPLAGLHEFEVTAAEDCAASLGFITALLGASTTAPLLWIGANRRIFPPALKSFGLDPDRLIFLSAKGSKNQAWAMEQALKCGALGGVVGEAADLDATTTRRFQLAIEGTGVPCFILRRQGKGPLTTATTRWHITPLRSTVEEGLPGVGHPLWRVELLKVRNGQPGTWHLGWRGGAFYHPAPLTVVHRVQNRKAV